MGGLIKIGDLIVRDVVNPDDIGVGYKSIGGLVDIKQELRTLIILPVRNPELFAGGKLLGPQKGILFYGPPGTGKTSLAKAIAKESGAVFINVSIANLSHQSPGEARKRVVALFSLATKLQPAILFIDECDSFLGKRRSTDHEVMISMKSEFMSLWSGFSTNNKVKVMVLATTNRPWELDNAILRRFSHSFEFPIPNLEERASILEVTLKGERVDRNIDYDYLASLCEGSTGSDLAGFCGKAAMIAVNENVEAKERGVINKGRRPLSQSDLETVLTGCKQTSKAVLEYAERQVKGGLNATNGLSVQTTE